MRLKTVTNCARCGEDHTDVEANEFGRPCGEHTHWSTCPTTGEPVLVRIVADAAQPGATETVTLSVTPEDAAALRALAHNLRTQDNRSTADPLFAVQQIREVWHVDPDEADRMEWLDSDCGSRADDELSARLEAIFETSEWERSDEEQALLDAHRQCACKEVWETVTIPEVGGRLMEATRLSQREFDRLPEYSCSLPTGTTVGKRWKRREPYRAADDIARWYMGEYYKDDTIPDGRIGIRWTRLVINAFAEGS